MSDSKQHFYISMILTCKGSYTDCNPVYPPQNLRPPLQDILLKYKKNFKSQTPPESSAGEVLEVPSMLTKVVSSGTKHRSFSIFSFYPDWFYRVLMDFLIVMV